MDHVTALLDEGVRLLVGLRLRNGLRRAADWGLASIALPPLGLSVGMTEPEESARMVLAKLEELSLVEVAV